MVWGFSGPPPLYDIAMFRQTAHPPSCFSNVKVYIWYTVSGWQRRNTLTDKLKLELSRVLAQGPTGRRERP